jgi:hypothetical protein
MGGMQGQLTPPLGKVTLDSLQNETVCVLMDGYESIFHHIPSLRAFIEPHRFFEMNLSAYLGEDRSMLECVYTRSCDESFHRDGTRSRFDRAQIGVEGVSRALADYDDHVMNVVVTVLSIVSPRS